MAMPVPLDKNPLTLNNFILLLCTKRRGKTVLFSASLIFQSFSVNLLSCVPDWKADACPSCWLKVTTAFVQNCKGPSEVKAVGGMFPSAFIHLVKYRREQAKAKALPWVNISCCWLIGNPCSCCWLNAPGFSQCTWAKSVLDASSTICTQRRFCSVSHENKSSIYSPGTRDSTGWSPK